MAPPLPASPTHSETVTTGAVDRACSAAATLHGLGAEVWGASSGLSRAASINVPNAAETATTTGASVNSLANTCGANNWASNIAAKAVPSVRCRRLKAPAPASFPSVAAQPHRPNPDPRECLCAPSNRIAR